MGTVLPEPLDDYRRDRMYDVLQVAQPAAGVDWSAKVPGGEIWRVLSIHALLTTSATVANRNALLEFRDADARVFCRAPQAGAITAGQGAACDWYVGAAGVAVAAWEVVAPLPNPPLPLFPGMVLGMLTGGIQVGDQWSAIAVYRELIRLRGKGAELRFERERERQRAELESAVGAARG